MKLASVVVAALLTGSLLVGCSESATCEDVDDLTAQLDETSPEDPEYNDIVENLKVAQADCNA
jgi:hypothetical protein